MGANDKGRPVNPNEEVFVPRVNALFLAAQERDTPNQSVVSRAVKDDATGFEGVQNVLTPPYDLRNLASLLEVSTRLSTCIHVMAHNTLGLGYIVVPKIPITEKTSKEDVDKIQAETEKVKALFDYPNDEMPWVSLGEQLKIDEEATGNAYLEVVRDGKGEISRLYSVPAHTMRIVKAMPGTEDAPIVGYVQCPITGTQRYVFFKKFGDMRKVNKTTGVELKAGDKLPLVSQASEIIHFKIYYPLNDYYGVPRYVGCTPAITGNRLAALRNVNFFDNDATPRLAIVVTNGRLADSSLTSIKKFLGKEGKGVENAHRVMVLQADSASQHPNAQSNTKVTIEPLTVGVKDDASFEKYRSANDEEIRESFGVSPIFLGTSEDVNKASAVAMRKITNEQVFVPDIIKKEYKLNATIIKDMKITMVELKLVQPKSTDELMEADIFGKLTVGGGITPNDIRAQLNKPRFEETWADQPMVLTLAQLQMGIGVGAMMGAAEGKSAMLDLATFIYHEQDNVLSRTTAELLEVEG